MATTSPIDVLERLELDDPEVVETAAKDINRLLSDYEAFAEFTVEQIFELQDRAWELYDRISYEKLPERGTEVPDEQRDVIDAWERAQNAVFGVIHFSSMGITYQRLGEGETNPVTVARMVRSGRSFGGLKKEMDDGFRPSVDLLIQMIQGCYSEEIFGSYENAIHVIGVLGGRVESGEIPDTTSRERGLAADAIVECLKLMRLSEEDAGRIKEECDIANRLFQRVRISAWVVADGFYLNQPFARAVDYLEN